MGTRSQNVLDIMNDFCWMCPYYVFAPELSRKKTVSR